MIKIKYIHRMNQMRIGQMDAKCHNKEETAA